MAVQAKRMKNVPNSDERKEKVEETDTAEFRIYKVNNQDAFNVISYNFLQPYIIELNYCWYRNFRRLISYRKKIYSKNIQK